MRSKGLLIIVMILVGTLSIVMVAQGIDVRPREKNFVLTAYQWRFEPSIIKVNLGDNVTIDLKSGDTMHGVFIDGYELEALICSEHPGALQFIANKPGRYVFRCSRNCGQFHPYMTGVLVVEPNIHFTVGSSVLVLTGIFAVFAYNPRNQKEEF